MDAYPAKSGTGFFSAIVRHGRVVLLLHALLFGFALVGLGRLRVDYSAEQFFLFDGDDRRVFDTYKHHFPREDLQVTALVEVGRLDGRDFDVLERIASSFEEHGLTPVRWLGSVDLPERGEEDGEPVVRFVRLGEEADRSEARMHTLIAGENRRSASWAGLLWSDDLSVFAVHGYLKPEDNTDAHRRALAPRLESVVREASGPHRRAVLTGLPTLRATIPIALERELVRLLGLAFLVSGVVLFAFLRRVRWVAICVAGVLPAVVLTLGVIGWSGRPMSVLTSFMPIVVLVVGVSDAIHLVVGTHRRWAEGLGRTRGVVQTFGSLSSACFFTSLTTALGFVGLVGTRIGIIGEFGVVTAFAVLATFAVTMTLLPVLLVAFSGEAPPAVPRGPAAGWIRGVAALASGRSGPVLLGTGVLGAAGVLLASGLRVEAWLIDDLRDHDPIVEELRWVEDRGFGVFQIDLLLTELGEDGHSPEMLAWIDDLQRDLESEPAITGSMGLPDLLLAPGDLFGPAGAEPGSPAEWAGASEAEIAERLFLVEIQPGDLLAEVYRPEEGVGQIVLFVRDIGSTGFAALFDRLNTRLSTRPPPVGVVDVTGTVRLSQGLWERLLSRFLPGLALSVALVWLALSTMLRSVWAGTLALLPNLVPLAILAGLMRVAGFDLKPSTVIVFSVAFGIVVDDTIHLLSALRTRLADGGRLEDVIPETVIAVGPALLVTTAVVASGFAVLVASRFEALLLMGLLTATAAVLALLVDLLGFPAFLHGLSRIRSMRRLFERKPS